MGKQKLNIPMCVALVLLLLTMISIHLTSGLYARYTTTATASDAARVAKFDVKSELSGLDGNYTLTVQNDSEIAVKYKVVVTFNEAMPEDDTLTVKLGDTPITTTDKMTYTTDYVGTLAPGAAPVAHILTIAVADWQDFTKDVTDVSSITKNLTFSVDVVAEQID